ncbi:hypothetical protein [Streptomyces sp. BBFR109]|uniref:hypothetical protein n=1 Tax=Streptomyces sp. BBFR109 TaxID=3448172 RepID=UPI003F7670D9
MGSEVCGRLFQQERAHQRRDLVAELVTGVDVPRRQVRVGAEEETQKHPPEHVDPSCSTTGPALLAAELRVLVEIERDALGREQAASSAVVDRGAFIVEVTGELGEAAGDGGLVIGRGDHASKRHLNDQPVGGLGPSVVL